VGVHICLKISGGANGGAYALGAIHGVMFGLLAAGLVTTIITPPLAAVFAAAIAVWVASVIAASVAVLSILGEEGMWCFTAGLLAGLEVGLVALGFSPGGSGIAIVSEMVLLALGSHINFPTAPQCNVYSPG
jgi:hypothetical protein